MVSIAVYSMIFLGSALMIYNIYGFIRYGRFVRGRENFGKEITILNIPIILLIMFFLGYVAVGIFGKPDLLVAGILFGGSIFVFVMLLLLERITKRIIENEQMEAQLLAAEKSNQLKNSFLASVSHEMRTPMNAILGLDTLALQRSDLPDETRKQLEEIGTSGKHLLNLINSTLDMQTIESGKMIIRMEQFSLNEIRTSIDDIADALCKEKGLTYRSIVKNDLRSIYMGDAMLIKKPLLNMIENSVKFTDAPGNVTMTVEQFPKGTDSCILRFTIEDTGIGMSPDFLPKAFELFSQEDTSSTNRYGGLGIGLTNAKQEAELIGGKISVKSEKGKGSVFTSDFPLRIVGKEILPLNESGHTTSGSKDEHGFSGKAEAEKASLEGLRILVVEDIEVNAEIITDLLELEGIEAECAENGRIACEMFEASEPGHFNAILMDLRMPEMDGLEAAKTIRSMDRSDAGTVPIIAVTANAFDSDIKNSLDAGMNSHIAKPVDAELLYDTLRKLING